MNLYTIRYTHPTGRGEARVEAVSGESAVSAWLARMIDRQGDDWAGALDWEVVEPEARVYSWWFERKDESED